MAPAPPNGRSLVVAIGIDQYDAWPRLENAVNDARGAALEFQRHGFALPRRQDGTEIVPLLDGAATHDAIRTLVEKDLEALDTADRLVVFFAGHGHTRSRAYPDGKVVKTGFLIPVDAGHEDSDERKWIRLDTLLSDIARLPSQHILVILDACYSGIALDAVHSFVRGRGESGAVPLQSLRAKRSRRVIVSARGDERAADNGGDGHSLFTGTLITALARRVDEPARPCLTGYDLASELHAHVRRRTGGRQLPDSGTFELDEGGELVIDLGADQAVAQRADRVADRRDRRAPPPPAPHHRRWPVAPMMIAVIAALGVASIAGIHACEMPTPFTASSGPTAPNTPSTPSASSAPGDAPLLAADTPCHTAAADVEATNPFVAVGPYLAQKFEVSEHEWSRFAACNAGAATASPSDSMLPKVQITQGEAQRFCRWLDARLPSSVEWMRVRDGVGARVEDGRFVADTRVRRSPRRDCRTICDLVDGVQELTSDEPAPDSDGQRLIHVMGGLMIMEKAEVQHMMQAGTLVPDDRSDGIGVRCLRSKP